MIGDHRVTSAKGESRWRFKIGTNGRHSNDAFVPTNARPDSATPVT